MALAYRITGAPGGITSRNAKDANPSMREAAKAAADSIRRPDRLSHLRVDFAFAIPRLAGEDSYEEARTQILCGGGVLQVEHAGSVHGMDPYVRVLFGRLGLGWRA